ncbi:MAG: hypothetical protein ABI224_16405 [Acetobacteraceae bacterium]
MADPILQITGKLTEARDEQVARIVALVDSMTTRGAADALIAPLRPRLQLLRPARIPRFGRLLFMPLDPVIVAADSWRGEACTVPRSAIEPIEAVIRAGLGSAIAPIEAAIARLSAPDPAAIGAIGACLWKPAASILLAAEAPPFPALQRPIAAILAAAAEIDAWMRPAPEAPAPTVGAMRTLLADALALGAGTCGMLGAILLARFPSLSAGILAAIAALSREDAIAARAAVDLAVGATIGHLETTTAADIGAAPLADAARAVQTAVGLLTGLWRKAGPSRRERLAANRANLDAKCRVRFAATLREALIAPLQGATQAATPSEASDLEGAARDLRRFEQAARELGNPDSYDDALRRAAEQVRALPDASPEDHADRVRLVEILAGSDQAVRLFAL